MGTVRAVDQVIAADSGAAIASGAGLDIDLLVGDLDSIEPNLLSALEAAGVEIERHPSDKDATDLALALDYVKSVGAHQVTVAGGGGGRLDHLLGNAAVIAEASRWTEVTWLTERATVHPVLARRVVTMRPGATFSLVAHGGPATDVTVHGARWPLDGATIEASSSLGISNEATQPDVEVAVGSGTVLVVVNE